MKQLLFFMCLNSAVAQETRYLENVFRTSLHTKFAQFNEHVLRQIDTSILMQTVAEMYQEKDHINDHDFYQTLYDKLPRKNTFITKINAIRYQKSLIGRKASSLMLPASTFHNCLEIGTPGTYLDALKSFCTFTGTLYVLHEEEKTTDYAQAFSFSFKRKGRAYDTFISLNNYDPQALAIIPSGSLDLIVCMIGFHHIPRERLAAFMHELARVLRPGGLLILREHDCIDDDTKAITYAAHSVFNVLIPHEPLATEMNEYRNFQPFTYWKEILNESHFDVEETLLVQDEDPTNNTLLKCKRRVTTQEEQLQEIKNVVHGDTTYSRDLMQTYLTSPEWYNVDASKDYSDYITHTPFYEFPYMSYVKNYWSLFAASYAMAVKKAGKYAVLTSPYTFMNLFIGTTMTIEYACKALISWPLRMMYRGVEDASISLLVQDPEDNVRLHGKLIEINTFAHSYKRITAPRYMPFKECVLWLLQHNVKIIEIAGHTEIQLKIKSTSPLMPEILQHTQIVHRWNNPTTPHVEYIALATPLSHLQEVLAMLDFCGAELVYIHDF